MNRSPDVELVLRDYFADDGSTAPDYVLDVVAERISRQPRRHAWRLPWRPFVNAYAKLAAAAAAILVVVFVGWQLLPSDNSGVRPTPTPSALPTATSITTDPSARPMHGGALEAGTYNARPIPGDVLVWQLTVPTGWTNGGSWYLYPTSLGLQGTGSGEPNGLGVAFLNVPEVVLDSCDFLGASSDTSSVAELVAAIQAKADWTVSTPVDIRLGEFSGQRVDIELPAELCPDQSYHVFREPGTENGFTAQGPAHRLRVWVLDVEGRIVILQSQAFPATPAKELAEAQQIIESSVITP